MEKDIKSAMAEKAAQALAKAAQLMHPTEYMSFLMFGVTGQALASLPDEYWEAGKGEHCETPGCKDCALFDEVRDVMAKVRERVRNANPDGTRAEKGKV